MAHNVDARYSTNSHVGRDQYNIHNYTSTQVQNASFSSKRSSPLSFNDAPIDLLSAHFTGREKELTYIREMLDIVHGDFPTRCALHGMPGLGKSQLTLQFAKLSFDRRQYPLIFWISATSIEKLNQGFARVLHLVEHIGRHHPEQSARLIAARRWLEESDMGGSTDWLLVFDNVNTEVIGFLREHLPRKNQRGNILFTTRTEEVAKAVTNSAGRQHEFFELQLPDLRDASKLLLEQGGVDANNASPSVIRTAESVVKCVGCLPLAVAQAASFMQQSHRNMDDLLSLYQGEHKIQVIGWQNNLSSYEERSVASTFSSQLEELEHQFPDTSNLLKILSFFDQESIALDMIVQGAQALLHQQFPSNVMSLESSKSIPGPRFSLLRKIKQRSRNLLGRNTRFTDQAAEAISPELKSLIVLIQSPVALQSAIQQLRVRSVVKYYSNDDAPALRIHDLIKFIIRESIVGGSTQSEMFKSAVMIACGAFRQVKDPALPEWWAQCEMFIPHIQSLTIWDDMHSSGEHELVIANMGIAIYLSSRGRYTEAERLFGRVLASNEKLFGAKHTETLRSFENLALVYLNQGRYGDAEILLGRALVGNEQQHGAEYPGTLRCVESLAVVYYIQGRYNEAEVLHARALAGNEKRYGANHPVTLRSMETLAMFYRHQGRYSEAETLCKRVLEGNEKQLGAEHPDTLWTVRNLARLYGSQGRYSEAETLFGPVLAGNERQLGADHPNTLGTVRDLAIVYRDQGRYSEAEILFGRALAGNERQLGAEHPDTLWTVRSLAVLYRDQGRYTEAEILFGRALAGNWHQFGADHSNTLWTVESLAELHRCQGRYSEAEILFGRALAGNEREFGADHPNTLGTVGSLAILYRDQGRYSEAEILFGRALPGNERQLGAEHPDTLRTVRNLAILYRDQGRYSEAENLFERALAGDERQLGADHPITLGTVGNLAILYRDQGRYNEAEILFGRALAGNERQLGAEHPDTLWTVRNLAVLYRDQGRYSEAEILFGQALAGSERQLGAEHPDTLRTVESLAILYQCQARYSEAEMLFGRALAGMQKQLGVEHPDTLHCLAEVKELQVQLCTR